jgi:acyl-CoA synthetase (AMP-forming)/AMP-acid ligase II
MTGASGVTGATLRTALDRLAASAGSIVTGVPPDEVMTGYRELLRRVAWTARELGRQGVRPGDAIVIRAGSSLADLTMLLGGFYLGAVVVSVKPGVPGVKAAGYHAEIARQQGARYCYGIDHPELAVLRAGQPPGGPGADRAEVADASAPDDVAFVQYTSGSTALPRPVPLTHRALLADIRGINSLPRRPGRRAALVMVPLHHDMGLVGLLSALVNDLDLYLVETAAFLRRPLRCLELAGRLGVTDTAMPDFLMRFLARRLQDVSARPRDAADRPPGPAAALPAGLLRSWDTVYCGAEPIRQQTVRDFLRAAGPLGLDPTALVFCYGLAEASLLVSAHRYAGEARSFARLGQARAACLGRPIAGLEVAVCRPDGAPAGDGELGEVRLRGSSMFNGYDGATDHRIAWFETGDLGYLKDGDLYLSGRRTDLVQVNGGNLFVTDVESRLLQRTDVADCVVLPQDGGFSVFVVAERESAFDPAAISGAVTAEFSVAPVSVRQVARRDIVRTASGKPMRAMMADSLVKGPLT